MFRTIVKFTSGMIVIICLVSCGDGDKRPEELIAENRLILSFNTETPEVQKHIAEIVSLIDQNDYQQALNELALLSATRRLSSKQKSAVDVMAKKLRYDMEEKIFDEQGRQE